MARKRRRNSTPLTIDQILAWADAYRAKHGTWPHMRAGAIDGTSESWSGVNFALYNGRRGMTGRSSLAEVLRLHRGVIVCREPLDEETIFRWAQAHHERTGKWPTSKGGSIEEAPGETWSAVAAALRDGRRGLPGGSTLAEVLADHGVTGSKAGRPASTLRPAEIMAWADSFFATHGHWPYPGSGAVRESPKTTWNAIDSALRTGGRGLKGNSSLARFLKEHGGVAGGGKGRSYRTHPTRLLDMEQIMAWAREHRERTGEWPKIQSGQILSAGITWQAVDTALKKGHRGLPGGSSLVKLFGDRRKVSRSREQSKPGE